jgi:glycosyltransferase involved in cell wall biosynthesis
VNVLVVSGIWPPDVGGPASHAPEVATFLRERGHRVEAVITADGQPAQEAYPVRWVSRRLPRGARHAGAAALVARRAVHADVVYSTGMFARCALAALAVQRPLVVKLTGDPAFERARWRGTVGGDVETFQQTRGATVRMLRSLRDLTLRVPVLVLCPSDYLRQLTITWGVPAERVHVLPNPVPRATELAPREVLRRELGMNGPTFVFAGRLTPQKDLGTAFEALARVRGASLVVAGEGDERDRLEAIVHERGLEPRVRFVGALPRQRVLELLRAADAALLSSKWENFPHAVVEALAVGTPVVATATGGVAEVVRDGENGLVVPPENPELLAAAIERYLGDEPLRERLRAAAAPSVARYAPERVYGELERLLEEVAAR